MARAFKPCQSVLDLVYKNFSSYKNLILFMGRNGQKYFRRNIKRLGF